MWTKDNYCHRSEPIVTPGCTNMLKKHVSKHSRNYSSFQLDVGSEAFTRALVTNCTAMTTAVKRTLKTINCDSRDKEETLDMMSEYLERNVRLRLHSSFFSNRKYCWKQRVEEQRCWKTASKSVRMAINSLEDTETKSAESMSQ